VPDTRPRQGDDSVGEWKAVDRIRQCGKGRRIVDQNALRMKKLLM